MANKRKHRNFPERLYNATIFSDGALPNVAMSDLVITKIEEQANSLKEK